ncbi:MAG: gamma-glutamyl-gamma-aminobutyrate hydrolase family protein [Planctomycetes bacterium]|nr:gamma-glutamyl-gamma-aminobutyrate hydrolase family protein [Planctomycetota bacterium]
MATKRPIVAISIGRHLTDPTYLRVRSTYPATVEAFGGLPMLLPPLEDLGGVEQLLARADGVLLPGGADVEPRHYGEDPHPTTRCDAPLDALELEMARVAVALELPTLGICRGFQVLNVALGGSLTQDLPDAGFHGHQQDAARNALTHGLELSPGARLTSILGSGAFEVNSFHHQSVQRVGSGLRPVGWSPDGVIEALEGMQHPWLYAVQYHPEDLVAFHTPSQRLFAAFTAACRERSARAGHLHQATCLT